MIYLLFLSTVFFIALAFGFDRGLSSFLPEKGKERILLMSSLLIIVLAPFALWQRKNEVKDLLKTPATADLANLILMDSRFEFPHNQKNSWISVPAFGVGLINFYELQLGQKYNYLSQWVSLSEFIGKSEFRRVHQKTKKNQSLSRHAKILDHQDRCVHVAFMAYERFRYGFQKMNCFYFSQFEVIEDKGISISAGPEVTN